MFIIFQTLYIIIFLVFRHLLMLIRSVDQNFPAKYLSGAQGKLPSFQSLQNHFRRDHHQVWSSCITRHRYEPFFVPPYCRYNFIIIPTDLASRSFETRVAMMPADQTNVACRSNVGRNFGSVQSMSIVTT